MKLAVLYAAVRAQCAFSLVLLACCSFASSACRSRNHSLLAGRLRARNEIKFNADSMAHYSRVATDLEHPDAHLSCPTQEAVGPPIVLSTDHEPSYRNLRLEEAVHLALDQLARAPRSRRHGAPLPRQRAHDV